MPKLYSENGKAYALVFKVAGVSKALGAVSRIVGAGNRAVLMILKRKDLILKIRKP